MVHPYCLFYFLTQICLLNKWSNALLLTIITLRQIKYVLNLPELSFSPPIDLNLSLKSGFMDSLLTSSPRRSTVQDLCIHHCFALVKHNFFLSPTMWGSSFYLTWCLNFSTLAVLWLKPRLQVSDVTVCDPLFFGSYFQLRRHLCVDLWRVLQPEETHKNHMEAIGS